MASVEQSASPAMPQRHPPFNLAPHVLKERATRLPKIATVLSDAGGQGCARPLRAASPLP